MKKNLRHLAALAMLISSAYSAQAQDCNCDHVISPPDSRATSLIIDGEAMGVKSGETVCISAGFYNQIRIVKMSGEPGLPIIIQNCGGVVEVGDAVNFGRWYAVDIGLSKYVRFTGTGVASTRYGIKLGKSGDTALKIGRSTDIEVDHIDVGNANFAGIMAKTDYGGKVPVNAPEMNNLNIHDNYIHDTRGEGLYIGETRTPGQDFRHLEIWNNVITRSGLDLLQVANVIEDVQVHHNVLYDGGYRRILGQNKGLQIGDNSVGKYYNNFIINSVSNFMIVMGSGDIDIYNNYLQGAGDPAFFIDNRSVTLRGKAINVRDNFMMEVRPTAPFINVFNEINPVNITGNRMEGGNKDVGYGSGAGAHNVTVSGNSVMAIERVKFIDPASDNFALATESAYKEIGVMEDVSDRNQRPFIQIIDDESLMAGTRLGVPVLAKDPDGDSVVLEAFNMPSFVSFQDNGNGTGVFMMAPRVTDVGTYYKVRVRVTDSKGAMNTQYYSITVFDRSDLYDEVRIYPNPVQDKVTIGFAHDVDGLLTVELTDEAGTSLLLRTWPNSQPTTVLDLAGLNLLPGMYYLKVAQEGIAPQTIRMFKE